MVLVGGASGDDGNEGGDEDSAWTWTLEDDKTKNRLLRKRVAIIREKMPLWPVPETCTIDGDG